MVNVVDPKCVHPDCPLVAPSYNYPDKKKGEYCAGHALPGMVNVIDPKCLHPGCTKVSPSFNYPGEKTGTHCKEHYLVGMVNVTSPRCKTNLCETIASCKKYDGYCLFCYMNLNPDHTVSRNYKTKEKAVKDYIQETFPNEKWVFDRRMDGGCSLRRPDICLIKDNYILIIETDENQHIRYDCSCENARRMQLYVDGGLRNIIFIRFNPDAYINQEGKKVKSCWSIHKQTSVLVVYAKDQNEWTNRLNTLKNQVNYWLKNKPEKSIETIQLFYDQNIEVKK
jgi:hypothetical protein